MENKIKLLIIEDDEILVLVIKDYLGFRYKDIEVVGNCGTVKGSIEMVINLKPDLILLDINLLDGNGFEIIEQTKHLHYKFAVISDTEYYGPLALKYSALHYFKKPFEHDEIIEVMNRYYEYTKLQKDLDELKQLKSLNSSENKNEIIKNKRFNKLLKDDILFCKSNKVYTEVYLKNNKTIVISKPLIHVLNSLDANTFIRISKTYLVNLNYITEYNISSEHTIKLTNENILKVGRIYRFGFGKKYNELNHKINKIDLLKHKKDEYLVKLYKGSVMNNL